MLSCHIETFHCSQAGNDNALLLGLLLAEKQIREIGVRVCPRRLRRGALSDAADGHVLRKYSAAPWAPRCAALHVCGGLPVLFSEKWPMGIDRGKRAVYS